VPEFYAKPKTKQPARGGLSGHPGEMSIPLTVMLLALDVAALHILRLLQAGTFLVGHDTVSLDPVFDALQVVLPLVETRSLAFGQLAGLHTLVDAALLVGLALVESRRAGLRKNGGGSESCNGNNQ
jgi:hypothetical protein